MNDLKEKLKTLPAEPGVYFFKDASGLIIYIGKASILKNRVRSYFQKSNLDTKTGLLRQEIADFSWTVVGSEAEALFLESELIKRYRPKYNIDWKDEKNFTYVRIPMRDEYPAVTLVRRPMDDAAKYFGPFTSSIQLKRALRALRKIFPYVVHAKLPPRACLDFSLGLCPGPEENAITSAAYKRNLRRLILFLSGQETKLVKTIESQMVRSAKKKDFEEALISRNQLQSLRGLSRQIIFGDQERFDVSADLALAGLARLLQLPAPPKRIEAYDISHMQGSDNVASMVVFVSGLPARGEYRKFRMRQDINDDFLHMREVIDRRLGKLGDKGWPPAPDLILIDGGKGQLAAGLFSMENRGVDIPTIGLAKRQEEIIRPEPLPAIILPLSSPVLQLLQRIRDEAHRFAVTYHAQLRGKRQTSSWLDDLPGIGPTTRKKLLRRFGSLRGVKAASLDELISEVGPAKAALIFESRPSQ